MFRTMGAFAAGFVTGWVGRGMVTSNREVLVRGVALAQTVRDRVTRKAAEQVEWWQDLMAEARARVEITRGATHTDEDARAKVVRVA
jgi:hypothetical protein